MKLHPYTRVGDTGEESTTWAQGRQHQAKPIEGSDNVAKVGAGWTSCRTVLEVEVKRAGNWSAENQNIPGGAGLGRGGKEQKGLGGDENGMLARDRQIGLVDG